MTTVKLAQPVAIVGSGTVAGPNEGKGPLAEYFDQILEDNLAGQKSWEKAEQLIMQSAIEIALKDAKIGADQIDIFIAGDLLNQIITSTFTARKLKIPFLGLYGACSTFIEGYVVGSLILQNQQIHCIVTATSSHNSTSERQFRFPTEYGGQVPVTAQYTVTGSGASVLKKKGELPGAFITHTTIGKVFDYGIKNPFEMGAAMAPAAVDTLYRHIKHSEYPLEAYDAILTGDLGHIGKKIVCQLMQEKGMAIDTIYDDCGTMIFSEKQKVFSGGSGCACSALVVLGRMFDDMRSGLIKRLIVVSTGALLSPTSTQQGDSIPGIAHAVTIEWRSNEGRK